MTNTEMKYYVKITYILPEKWTELTQKVLSNKKFDKEEFIVLFNETFEVLRYCSCEDEVNRGMIQLVKMVSGFIATRFAKLDYYHLAACELADAMLTNCLQYETTDEPISKGKWFRLTSEIDIDFLNVEDELFNFSQDLKWADDIT